MPSPVSDTVACVCLREPYALSDTTLAYGDMRVRASCEVSGTVIAYGAVRLRARYAMSGTEIAYGTGARASTSPEPRVYRRGRPRYPPTRLLCAVRYRHAP
eukprot:3935597-Rhodomonas_salina.2